MGKRAMELALVTAQRHGDDADLYVIEKCHTLGVPSDVPEHHRTDGLHPLMHTATEAFAVARNKAGMKVEAGRTPPILREIRTLAIRLYKKQYREQFAQAFAWHRNIKSTMLNLDPRDTAAKRMLTPDPHNPRVLD